MLSATLQRRAGLQSTNDYNRYRSYASHRVKKLRRREQLSLRPKANASPKPLAEPKHWPIAILLAERDWASAMETKSALEADAAPSAKMRDHMLSKYAKAAKHAAHAATLVKPISTDSVRLELAVYVALLEGDAAVEKQQWSAVALAYSKARVGLLALGGSEVYTDYVAAKIDPVLRLAFGQSDHDRSVSIPRAAQLEVDKDSAFAALLQQVDPGALSGDATAPTKKLGDIQFRFYSAQVKDADLAQVILEAQTKDKELSARVDSAGPDVDPATFDSVLALWQEAVSLVLDLLANNADQDTHVVSTYVQFRLLYRRIQRDNFVAAKEKGGNAVRIYDAVLQSCTAMSELPGVFSDDALTTSIEGMQLYFRTLRTIAAAESHPRGSREALALVNYAHKRLQTPHEISVDLPVRKEQLEDIVESVAQQLTSTHGLTVIFREVANRSSVRGSVSSDISFFPVAKPGVSVYAADLKGEHLEAVPVKPVFYDIAYNYLRTNIVTASRERSHEPPFLREASVESTDSQKAKKKLFGIF